MAVTVNCWVLPFAMLELAGVITIEAMVAGVTCTSGVVKVWPW